MTSTLIRGFTLLIPKLALRNLLRNTRRTLLTVLLIGCSLGALILTDAVMIGMVKVMVESLTTTFAGEAQVHRQGFRDNSDVDLYLPDSAAIEQQLEAEPTVAAYASRVISGGMIASSYNVTAGMIYGVNGPQEAQVGKLAQAITKGQYLQGGSGELLMGAPMADLLEVGVGDRIVLTLTEADSGELAQALFRVSGIFEFGVRELDANLVIIDLQRARQILGLDNASHEIAIRFVDASSADRDPGGILQTLNHDDVEALGWRALNKDVNAMLDMTGYSSFIVGAILFLLASLGVINSMFMSIYERIYEFGVAKAIGTRPQDLFLLILTEALLLALLSCAFGMLLGFGLGHWYGIHGIPMGEMEVAGIAMNNNIPTVLAAYQFTTFPLYVILLTLLAALYPARFAAAIVPADALHRSL
jgi:ABC-type lipoprotein release transport system permease subunit